MPINTIAERWIGSFVLGLGAFLIAMTFRPFPKNDRPPAVQPAE